MDRPGPLNKDIQTISFTHPETEMSKKILYFYHEKEIMAHFTKKLIVLYSPKKELLAHFMKKSKFFYVLSK